MSKKSLTLSILAVLIIVVLFCAFWMHKLAVAHSTFDNYYAFRGCTQLIERTDAYGICKTTDGATIKIVAINGRWYLEGDGPGIW
jgi:hypothetical protein